MNWAIMITGAVFAVTPFYFTATVNGLSLLGAVVMVWGASRLMSEKSEADDVPRR